MTATPNEIMDILQQDGEKGLFPHLLHDLLEDAEKSRETDVVSWRPSGGCFKVHKREEFMSRILPKYFRQTRYKSFVRQLNIWGFACIGQGPDKGSCKCSLVNVGCKNVGYFAILILTTFSSFIFQILTIDS
jgi:hypothetical protein